MCEQSVYKVKPKSRIDRCLRTLIYFLNSQGIKTVACCCGHGKYPMTILVRYKNFEIRDIVSDTLIPRTRNFYKSDGDGGWFIPEVLSNQLL